MAKNPNSSLPIAKMTIGTQNLKQLNDAATIAIKRAISSRWNFIILKIEKRIREIVLEAIKSSSTYQDLINPSSRLTYELGLMAGKSRIDGILGIMVDNVVLDFKQISGKTKLRGNLRVRMIQGDYRDIISSSQAYQLTEKNQELKWLEWLLTLGSDVIIREYDFVEGQNFGSRSRTGGGIMVKNARRKRWFVPYEHSGTTENNFITRAIDKSEEKIYQAIMEELEKWVS